CRRQRQRCIRDRGADSRSLCRTIRNRGKIDPILVSDPAQVATMLAPVLTGNDLKLGLSLIQISEPTRR
ncbi:hypothetical protein V3C21_25045, partial [Salmonella enterica subsp. enterica serovar Paratyphi B]|uniref:hypothetical protein n=1 Tax=Salmonella enterica TaxID=28901 RepID=UPI0030C79B41